MCYNIVDIMCGGVGLCAHDATRKETLLAIFMSPDEVREFESLFASLDPVQQDWLIVRRGCVTDREACEQSGVSYQALAYWKRVKEPFRRCDELLKHGFQNLEAVLVMAIERRSAVRAAQEKRALIEKPWKDMTAREASAKAIIIRDTLDRVAPKRTEREVTHNIHVFDVLEETDAANSEGEEDTEGDAEAVRG